MIAHNKPSINLTEYLSTIKVIRSRQLSSKNEVAELERELARFYNINAENVAVVSSGSAALFISTRVASLNEKVVGVPIYTCNAVCNSIKLAGAIPKFLDSKPNHVNSDYTKCPPNEFAGIIGVSTFGVPAELPKSKSITIIEDISTSFGSVIQNEPIGLRGLFGISSLGATKVITSGGSGGLIISTNTEAMREIKDFINFDNRSDRKLRFNLKLTDLQAAVGRQQLKKLKKFKTKREELFQLYLNHLGPANIPNNPDNIKYRILFKTRNQLSTIENLQKNGIKSIVPFTTDEFMDEPKKYPHAYDFAKKNVSLPIYPNLSRNAVRKICRIIEEDLIH